MSQLICCMTAMPCAAGEPIATRWTAAHKREIKRSRVATTRAVVDAMNALPAEQRPRVLVSTSAVGELRAGCDRRRSQIVKFVMMLCARGKYTSARTAAVGFAFDTSRGRAVMRFTLHQLLR